MIRRSLLVLAVICLILTMIPLSASAATVASGYAGPNASWSLDSSGHLKIYGSGLIGFGFTSPEVVTNGHPWGDYADEIITVTIGYGITAIEKGAFIHMRKLCEVTVPASVTEIRDYAFYNCPNLMEVHLQEGLESIGRYAFSKTGLPYIQLPDTLKTIGGYAFAGSSLLELEIPTSVTTMDTGVAANCQLLLTASVPAGIITPSHNINFGTTPNLLYARIIGDKPLGFDSYFRSSFPDFCIFYDEGTNGWENTGSAECMVLPWKEPEPEEETPGNSHISWYFDSGTLYVSGKGAIDDVTLIMEYKNNAPWEKHNAEIKSVVIQDGITQIGKGAFAGLPALKTVTLPKSVSVIDDFAFYNCFALETVKLADGLTTIGAFAFQNTGMSSIALPESVESLGIYAFSNSGLTSITLPANINTVSMGLFYDCPNLASVTTLGPIENIGDCAFQRCGSLSEVTFLQGAAGSIGISAFESSGLSTFDIPEGITRICEAAFRYCSHLESIEIPNTVRQIDKSAFESTKLDTIIFPESVTTLDYWVLSSCDYLKSITVHSKTLENFEHTFGSTPALEYVHVIGNKPENDNQFSHSFAKELTVYYDEGTSGWEGNTWNGYILSVWGKPDTVREGTCGENAVWSLENGILTISGAGAMEDYERNYETPWYLFRNRVIDVVVEEGITHIGSHAFQYITTLETVSLPKSLLTIGFESMADCNMLQSIQIPENVTEIMDCAFQRCSKLETASMGNSVTTMGTYVFAECTSLVKVTLSDGLTEIPNDTFFRCRSLADVIIPQGVTTIGWSAFRECSSLQVLAIPDSVTQIQTSAFEASGILELMFPKSVTDYGFSPYDYCESLRAVHYQGDPPSYFDYSGPSITIYYPSSNGLWLALVSDNRNHEQINWVGCESVHDMKTEVKEPTCTEAGSVTTGCPCGYGLEEKLLEPLGHSYLDGICQNCGEEKPDILPGDADLDGVVTYLDAMIVLRAAVGLETLEADIFTACDMDANAELSYLDAMSILLLAVGLK